MLDKLIDFVLSVLDLFRFWTVVTEGDRTVIYTLGRPTRLLEPSRGWFATGLYLKAPLNIETDTATSVREEIRGALAQDLVTKDGTRVHVIGVFRFQIVPEKVILWQVALGNEELAEQSALRGAVAEAIERHTYAELMDLDEQSGFKRFVLENIRRRLNPYGYKIYDFWFSERTSAKTYRFITGE